MEIFSSILSAHPADKRRGCQVAGPWGRVALPVGRAVWRRLAGVPAPGSRWPTGHPAATVIAVAAALDAPP